MWHRLDRKQCLQQFFIATGMCLLSHCLAAIGGYSVQSSKLLVALASTVILGSESHGTHDHILLSDGSGSLKTTTLAVHILKLVIHRQAHRLSFDMTWTVQKTICPSTLFLIKITGWWIMSKRSSIVNCYIVACVFVAAGTCLPSHLIGGYT
jgi:hypothetical protein